MSDPGGDGRGAIRCLVLNIDIGSGHRRAAEGLWEAISTLRPDSTVRFVEALEYLGPDAGMLAKELYLGVQRNLPDLWGLFYEQRPLFDLLRPLGELVDELRSLDLKPLVRKMRPHVIVATHPIACGLGAAVRRDQRTTCPLVALMTDFDGHPAWVVRGIDLYLAATPEVAGELKSHGLPTGRVVSSGIPLRPDFARIRADQGSRGRLGLAEDRFTVLLLGGGLGLGPVLETCEELAALEGPIQLVLIAGSNRDLEKSARSLAGRSSIPLHVRGHIEDMWDYMGAADVAIGKPGGLTCAELMAAGVPLIALQPLAGQEEANCSRLVGQGAACHAPSAREARQILAGLLRDPGRLHAMRQAALGIGRPSAAVTAARSVLELIEGQGEE